MAAAYAILAGSFVPCKGNGMKAVWADGTSRLMGKWIFDNQINKKVHGNHLYCGSHELFPCVYFAGARSA